MEVQGAISKAKLARKVGREMTVLVDEVHAKGIVARSAADAPEIDGLVHVATKKAFHPGDLVRVVVTAAGEHDLTAKLAA